MLLKSCRCLSDRVLRRVARRRRWQTHILCQIYPMTEIKKCKKCLQPESDTVRFSGYNRACNKCRSKPRSMPPRTCRTCNAKEGKGEGQVKFSRNNRSCNKCQYKKHRSYMDKYIKHRLDTDPSFVEHERLRAARKRKRRYDSGKTKEYQQRSIRTWLHNRTGNALTNRKKRNLEYTISLDFLCELWTKQDGKCAITKLGMSHQFNCPYAASIDRIDSSKGYTKDNVQLLCQFINLGKNRMSNDSIVEFVEAIRAG